MTDLKMHTPNLTDTNIAKLAELFPHCITERPNPQGGVTLGVDFDLLRQELSSVVVEGDQERYCLDWVGKREAMLTANAPIAKTLRPLREQSVDFDTTQNLFIEGDNLDALKLLQESYLDKVKMIYIDPPYNTGNDFIYKDNFAESTQTFLERSEQIDEEGNRLVANTESSGRYHSDWLSMMYSRLKLARNLLTDDGVIFISIDDNEQANLKKICDEVFGIGNFIANIPRKGSGGRQDSTHFAVVHEYIIVYAKNPQKFIAGKDVKELSGYNKIEEITNRKYKTQLLRKWGENSRREDRPNLYYPILAPDNSKLFPLFSNGEESRWRWGRDTMNKALEENRVEFLKDDFDNWVAYEKLYEDESDGQKLFSTWIDEVSTSSGARLLKLLFDEKKVFDYPKPVDLIMLLMKMANIKENDIILDFFGGSATTAHATLGFNAENNINTKFVIIQLPEEINREKLKEAFNFCQENNLSTTIAEISKERIRRAGTKIKAESADQAGIEQLDTGFRVLKVDDSNMQDVYYRPQDLTLDLVAQMVDHIKSDRSDEDLLFQVMLDLGLELSLPIECRQIDGQDVYFVAGNSLVACFNNLSMAIIDEVATIQPLYFVSCERAIQQDHDKANFKERFGRLSHQTDVRFI